MHRTYQRRNQTSPRREAAYITDDAEDESTSSPPGAPRGRRAAPALYDGAIYDGEYGDGNIAGLILAAGKRKSGKTFLGWDEVALICRHRRVIFDTLDQYTAEKGYNLRGWTIVHQPGELKQLLARSIHSDTLKVIYKPMSGDKKIHFRAVTRVVLNYGTKSLGVIYLVDEVDKFCSPKEELKKACPPLHDLVEYGRHFKVSCFFTTRRPHKVSRDLTAECAEFRIFKTTEPRDKDYFEEFIGSAVEMLPKLGKYEYVWWIDDAHREAEVRGGPKKRGAIHDNEPNPR